MFKRLFLLVCFVFVLCLSGSASALVWENDDIGNGQDTPGSATDNGGGNWTVVGAGGDIWGNADGFHYAYAPVSGDCNMTIELVSMDLTSGWAKVGIMLRETLDPGSKEAAMTLTGSNGVQMIHRQFTDGGSGEVQWLRDNGGAEVAPIQLRLRRAGNDMYGAFWAPIIPGMPWVGFTWWEDYINIPDLSTDAYIGLAVCSGNTGALNTSQFAQVDWPAAPYYKAWKLSPDDGLTRLPTDPLTLSWNAGDGATSHDVYFGTTNPPPFVQNQAATTFDTGALATSTTYYWQINEVGPGGSAGDGDVRFFKTARVIVGTGAILGEIWWDMGGVTVPDLTNNSRYPFNPSMSQLLPLFEAPVDMADNFGGRFTGLLIPEASGDYTFWIASDDASELWLSTDDKAWNASQIAYVSGWACSRCWDQTPAEQQSAPVYLEGDQMYFIQAIYKEGGGGDNCSVAWQGPDQPSRDAIDGYYLSPSYPFAADNRPLGGTFATKELKQLQWRAGSDAASHDVQFGTSDPPPFLVNQTDTVLPLGALIPDTDYYWQINEVNGPDMWVGQVLGFSTAEWIHLDIGPTLPGSSEYDGASDTWTITANGYDIWDNDDKFRYVYTMPDLTRGDCTVQAHVTSIVGGTNDWRKAGVMIRESRSPGSKQATMAAVPQCMSLQYRTQTNGGSADQTNWDQTAPGYVKLVREGDVFTGYRSVDGVEWLQVGQAVIEMPEDVLVGMAVTSHDVTQLTTVTFEGFSISTPDPHQSWAPSPQNGAEGVPIDPELSWAPGEGAMYHIVYFSENYDDVVSGAAYKGMMTSPTYDPGILDLTKTYYWAVDEMWGDGRNIEVTLGNIWSFTVSDHRVVEDFESYDIEPELPAQDVVVPADTVVAEALPAQVEVDPGYTIPGYTIAAVDPGSGCLIADWAFEGNYDDTSGSGFHGTPVGDANIVADPCRGNVLSLDGDGDYVNCGNPAALNFSTGNWSMSVWTKNTMSGTGDDNKGTLISNGDDSGGGIRYCLIVSEQDEGEVTLVTDDDSDKRQARGDDTQVNDDVWHHVLGVRDGDTIRIYINGVEEGSAGLPGGYDLSGTVQREALIGAIYNHGNDTIYKDYAGLIDDARIYNCALTENNARFLAEVGNLVVPPVVIPPSYGPLLVSYEFEGDATDSSGNGRDGVETAGRDGDMPTYEASMASHGQAISFNDDGDHVLDDDAALYMNGLDALTVSAWIKSGRTDRDEGWVHFSTSWNDQRSFRYDKDGGSSSTLQHIIKYGVATTGGSEEDESSDWVQTTEWQHVAMTWQSGTGIKLYIDGVRDENLGWDSPAVTGVLSGYSVLHVGKGSKDDSDNESWRGLVDDVQIYSAALSYGQIRTLAGKLDPLPIPPVYGPVIGEFMFDADASDTSGNDNHGTLLGDAIVEDGVLKLDGDGDCVDLGRADMYNMGQGPFSFSVWVNMSAWGGGWGSNIIGKRGENGRGWVLRRRGDSVHLTWTTRGPGDNDPEGTIELTTNEWHHIIGVYDGSSKVVYIDGAEDRYTGGVHDITMSGHNVYIGARANRDNNGQENHFNGMIDDVQFFNYALNCIERLSLSRLPAVNTLLHDTWTDSGAEVVSTLVGPECDSVHWGVRAMRLDLNGSGEVSRMSPYEDLTAGQTKALVLYLKGDPDNVVDDLYLKLTSNLPSGKSATLAYNGDMSDLKIPDWQEWNFDLAEIMLVHDEEFPLPHTGKLAIGISGTGTVYFDDLWLMTSRCVPDYAQLGDFTGDCLADKRDLRLLADDWLNIDEFGSGLIARYEFEGNYDDSSGNGRHGTPVGAGITIETDATMGQVLSLPGGDNVFVEVGAVGNSGNDPVTIACWAKADNTSIPDWTLVFGFTGTPDGGGDCGSHFNIGSIGGPGGVGAHLWCWEATIFTDTEALEWRHYAMTFDGSTINYYGDGVNKGSTSMDLWRRGDRVHIGKRVTQASSFPGDIDDARVYRRALSDDEIVAVMGGADPEIYIPLVSAANVSDDEPQGSKIINFKDFNVLGGDWLTEQLWP